MDWRPDVSRHTCETMEINSLSQPSSENFSYKHLRIHAYLLVLLLHDCKPTDASVIIREQKPKEKGDVHEMSEPLK